MRKGISATVFALIVCVLILQACSKIPCYPASHFNPPANANYTAEEVRLKTPAGHMLAGTLTLPSDRPPPHPAVVLITGSSPQNRDMMGHWAWPASAYRPFRQIADALAAAPYSEPRLLCQAVRGELATIDQAVAEWTIGGTAAPRVDRSSMPPPSRGPTTIGPWWISCETAQISIRPELES